jgi:hypothetical protein
MSLRLLLPQLKFLLPLLPLSKLRLMFLRLLSFPRLKLRLL